jgi:hypothetical protein
MAKILPSTRRPKEAIIFPLVTRGSEEKASTSGAKRRSIASALPGADALRFAMGIG